MCMTNNDCYFSLSFCYCVIPGRVSAHDVAAFAKDCSVTPVEVLSPTDFPDRVQHSQDMWFVDFFAPVSTVWYVSKLRSLTHMPNKVRPSLACLPNSTQLWWTRLGKTHPKFFCQLLLYLTGAFLALLIGALLIPYVWKRCETKGLQHTLRGDNFHWNLNLDGKFALLRLKFSLL